MFCHCHQFANMIGHFARSLIGSLAVVNTTIKYIIHDVATHLISLDER